MLAQLKTVVMIRGNTTSLDYLSIWTIGICGFDYRIKMATNEELSSETRQSILVSLFHARN